MKIFRIVIIEDEPRAARQLQKLITNSTYSFEVLSILDSVEEAVSWLETNPNPDLIFMDIQLADGLSFEIFHKTEVKAPIIFTTAFDQYAIRAFKVNSIDYLLKPIQKEDLQQAIQKFLATTYTASINSEVLKELLHSLQAPNVRNGILVKEGSAYVQVPIATLAYIYSETSITFGITIDNKRYIIDETMDQVQSTLPYTDFFRINRGQIVHKSAIQKIEPYFNHRLKLEVLHDRNQDFIVSRQKASNFKEWLNS